MWWSVVFDEHERVLLPHHAYRQRYPWGLPDGWVSGNERLEQGLERELREETGFDIAVGEVVYVRSGYRHPQIRSIFSARIVVAPSNPTRRSMRRTSARSTTYRKRCCRITAR